MLQDLIDGKLITALYGPAAQEGDWNPALRRFREILNSFDTTLSVFDRGTSSVRTETTGFVLTPERRESYIAHYMLLDPKRRIFAQRGEGFLFNDIAHFDDDFVARDPFYQEFSRPIGSRHTLDMLVRRDPAREIYLAAVRSAEQGAFDGEAELVFRNASKHFVRAFELKQTFDAAACAGAALETLNFGIAVLDAHGRVVLLNARAQSAFGIGEEVQLRRGCLVARSGSVERALQAAIAAALAGNGGASVLRIARPNGGAWILWCVPLRASSWLARGHAPGVVLVLRDANAYEPVKAYDLAILHGLTPAEAALALSLARGETLQTYARERRIKFSTARWHLLSVMQKMGVHRQADVIRMLASMSNPLDP